MYKNLIRNKDAVMKAIHQDSASGVSVALDDIEIYFPKHYMNGKLGHIDNMFNVVAIFGIVCGNNYAVSSFISWMPLTPEEVSLVKIDDVDYYKLSWGKGGIICPNLNLVKNDQLVYEVDNEINGKGKTPWYLDVHDIALLRSNAKTAANVDLGAAHSILELGASIRARDVNNRFVFIKEIVHTQEELDNAHIAFIPMNSVAFAVNNTFSRTLGSNLREGLVASIVEPSNTSEGLEVIMRS